MYIFACNLNLLARFVKAEKEKENEKKNQVKNDPSYFSRFEQYSVVVSCFSSPPSSIIIIIIIIAAIIHRYTFSSSVYVP